MFTHLFSSTLLAVGIVALIYTQLSIEEWGAHKYMMHSEELDVGKWHVTHHKATRSDMTVDTNTPDYHTTLPTENLCLDIQSVVGYTLSVVPTLAVVYWCTRSWFWVCYAALVATTLIVYSVFMWNSLHPYLHHRDGRQVCGFGMCRKQFSAIRNTAYMRFLYDNHITHHLKKTDKGNYNVTFPGADFLFGTYFTEKDLVAPNG